MDRSRRNGKAKRARADDVNASPFMPTEEFYVRLSSKLSDSPTDTFETLFKMSKSTFEYVYSVVWSRMRSRTRYEKTNVVIPPEEQTALALWRLRSGQTLAEIGRKFQVHHSNVAQITVRVVEALEETCLHHLRWPSTEQEMNEVKSGFEKISGGLLNCCGAIDISHIRVTPSMGEEMYWCDASGNFSMIVQAIVGPDLRFLDIFAGCPSGTMASTVAVLRRSKFFKLAQQGKRLSGKRVKLAEGHGAVDKIREYLVGDAAYPLLPWLLTPYMRLRRRGRAAQNAEEFNKSSDMAHVVARRALKMLKTDWKMIGGGMWKCNRHMLARFVLVCCILHNIIIEKEGLVEMPLMDDDDHDPGYPQEVCRDSDSLVATISRDNLSEHLRTRASHS